LVVEDSKNIDLGEEVEAASHTAEDKKVALDDPAPDPVVAGFHKNPAVAAGPVVAEDIVVGILHLLHHLHIVNHELSQTIVFQPLSQVSSSHRRQKEFVAPKSKILSLLRGTVTRQERTGLFARNTTMSARICQ
jgi:hypothetical protein